MKRLVYLEIETDNTGGQYESVTVNTSLTVVRKFSLVQNTPKNS